MSSLLISLFYVFLFFVLGIILGKKLSPRWQTLFSKSIGPFIIFLLFNIGIHFGQQISVLHQIGLILGTALAIAIATTFFSFMATVALYKNPRQPSHKSKPDHNPPKVVNSSPENKHSIQKIILESTLALLYLGLGIIFALVFINLQWSLEFMPSQEILIYILLFLIGIDIAHIPLHINQHSVKVLLLPLLIIMASLLGGVLISSITSLTTLEGMVLASGMGWFSISSVIVTSEMGSYFGALALFSDLFRELLSILIIYILGYSYPNGAVATAGATAMDTTLPFIKKVSGAAYMPLALYVGVSLSFIAPLLLSYLIYLAK